MTSAGPAPVDVKVLVIDDPFSSECDSQAPMVRDGCRESRYNVGAAMNISVAAPAFVFLDERDAGIHAG